MRPGEAPPLEQAPESSRDHVSGRRISLLRKLVRLPGIRLLGLYGFESDEKIALPLAVPRELPRLRAVLRPLPAELPGIRLEDKGISVAIHFRGALADNAAARERPDPRE